MAAGFGLLQSSIALPRISPALSASDASTEPAFSRTPSLQPGEMKKIPIRNQNAGCSTAFLQVFRVDPRGQAYPYIYAIKA